MDLGPHEVSPGLSTRPCRMTGHEKDYSISRGFLFLDRKAGKNGASQNQPPSVSPMTAAEPFAANSVNGPIRAARSFMVVLGTEVAPDFVRQIQVSDIIDSKVPVGQHHFLNQKRNCMTLSEDSHEMTRHLLTLHKIQLHKS
jgi:hypothetical protein